MQHVKYWVDLRRTNCSLDGVCSYNRIEKDPCIISRSYYLPFYFHSSCNWKHLSPSVRPSVVFVRQLPPITKFIKLVVVKMMSSSFCLLNFRRRHGAWYRQRRLWTIDIQRRCLLLLHPGVISRYQSCIRSQHSSCVLYVALRIIVIIMMIMRSVAILGKLIIITLMARLSWPGPHSPLMLTFPVFKTQMKTKHSNSYCR